MDLLEERLLALETVHDCKVMRRPVAGGSRQQPQPGRLVGYVVPASSVRPERLNEWIASLHKHCFGGNGADFDSLCDLIAVSRLPLTVEGQIDEAALASQAVLDDELTQRWEDHLKGLSGIQDAMVLVELEQEQLPPIHYSDLFPESQEWERGDRSIAEATQPTRGQKDSPSTPSAERRLAICYGGEIEAADQLPLLLGETLQGAAQRHPDHGLRTIVDGAEQFLSYPELLALADRLRSGLCRAGLHAGDRVIFQFIHNQDFLTAFWACVLGGFVPAPLAPSHLGIDGAASKLHHAWKLLDASLVLTTRELAPPIRAILRSSDIPKTRVECVEDLSTSTSGEWHVGEPHDLALVMLTSGSTGNPKAVMLSHRNLIRRSAGSAQMNGFSSDDVTLNWMPLDHVAGIVYFHLRDVFLGCQQIHAATNLVTHDPLIWPEWVDRYRVTITFAPNFAFGLVNDRAEAIAARSHSADGTWDLSCLRYLLNGAEAIVPRTARRFLQLFAPYGLSPAAMWPVWGMSETSSGTIYSQTFRLESSRDDDQFVEVGRPIPGFSTRIVDANDQPIMEGEIGSLQVKGDQVMAGYYNRPDLTAESFTSDGWFKTGDLGLLSRGRLTITGREKDVIVINSVNYACHEIEALVEEIDDIETSFTAACAIRDSGTNTDRMAIFFHPLAGCEAVSAELVRTIRSALSRRLGFSPDYLLPVERDAIPKTSIGKIQRPQLAKSFADGKFADVVKRVEILMGGANTLPNWFFRPVWRRAESRGRCEIGPMLVFADSLGLGESLRQEAVAIGRKCVLVSQGPQFVEDGDRFTILPGNSEHYTRLFEALVRRCFEPQSIVHLWTYCEDLMHPGDRKDFDHTQETGVLSILQLVQAMGATGTVRAGLRIGLPPVRLAVISNGLQCVDDDASGTAFEKAPLLGLLKTIPQENPALACCHLDLPIAANKENTALVLNELSGQTRDTEVAYRRGLRWVRRLRRAEFSAESVGSLPIEKGGLYLLSGGLGGIGLELARYLLKQFQASLVLVGRTKMGSDAGDRSAALGSLETLAAAHGGKTLYAAVDVGDQEGLRTLVAQAEESFGRTLGGVFHLAGLYHECTVAEETADGLATILHPKLAALALHQLLADRPGALFVSFSSVNGFMGGYGVSAYAAANAFLESFSEYQRTARQVNAYCISWSLWDDVGMSRGYVVKDAARGRGFYAISARQGLASLLAILHRPPGHALVGLDGDNLHLRRLTEDLSLSAQSLVAHLTGDSKMIARLVSQSPGLQNNILDRYGTPTICYLKKASQAMIGVAGKIDRQRALSLSRMGVQSVAAPIGPADELERIIAKIWREVLRVDQLGVTDNFFDLGGSSLAMGQANGRLQETLKRKVSMTETFQYSTVRTLAAYLSGSNKVGSAPELGTSQSRGERRREMMRARRR